MAAVVTHSTGMMSEAVQSTRPPMLQCTLLHDAGSLPVLSCIGGRHSACQAISGLRNHGSIPSAHTDAPRMLCHVGSAIGNAPYLGNAPCTTLGAPGGGPCPRLPALASLPRALASPGSAPRLLAPLWSRAGTAAPIDVEALERPADVTEHEVGLAP